MAGAGLPGSTQMQLRWLRSVLWRAPAHLCCSRSPGALRSFCLPPSPLLYQNKKMTNTIHLHLIDHILSENVPLQTYAFSFLASSNFGPQATPPPPRPRNFKHQQTDFFFPLSGSVQRSSWNHSIAGTAETSDFLSLSRFLGGAEWVGGAGPWSPRSDSLRNFGDRKIDSEHHPKFLSLIPC